MIYIKEMSKICNVGFLKTKSKKDDLVPEDHQENHELDPACAKCKQLSEEIEKLKAELDEKVEQKVSKIELKVFQSASLYLVDNIAVYRKTFCHRQPTYQMNFGIFFLREGNT